MSNNLRTTNELMCALVKSMSHIYLGPVKNFRKELSIPTRYHDDMIVSVYGREHWRNKNYNRILELFPDSTLGLPHFSIFDAERVIDAEHALAEKMRNFQYEWNDANEVWILNKTDAKHIRIICTNLCIEYGVTDREINKCIDLLKEQMVNVQPNNRMGATEFAFTAARARIATIMANKERAQTYGNQKRVRRLRMMRESQK